MLSADILGLAISTTKKTRLAFWSNGQVNVSKYANTAFGSPRVAYFQSVTIKSWTVTAEAQLQGFHSSQSAPNADWRIWVQLACKNVGKSRALYPEALAVRVGPQILWNRCVEVFSQ